MPARSSRPPGTDAGCALVGYTREELLETPISRIHPAELAELSQRFSGDGASLVASLVGGR